MMTTEEIIEWIEARIRELSKTGLGNYEAIRELQDLLIEMEKEPVTRGMTPEAEAARQAGIEKARETAITVKALVNEASAAELGSYIAFGNELRSKETQQEKQIAYDKWKTRGLTQSQLDKIASQYNFVPS